MCGTIVAQVAIDRVAPFGARASSQALLVTASAGAGRLFGQVLCGAVLAACSLPHGGYAWPTIFSVPLVLGLIATLIVLGWFHPSESAEPPARLIEEEPPPVSSHAL